MSNTLVSLPLCALRRSKLNVRKTDRSQDIEQLAASIASQGLLENLVVRPISGDSEFYEVIAGGRRLAALKLLAKKKTLPDDHSVSCLVLASGEAADIVEASLAENMIRAPIHPADQYEAFAKLQREGLSADDIAARFGLHITVVRQRLKLAAVSPKLIKAYRARELDLEQLMAFTVTNDWTIQEDAWDQLKDTNPDPRTIKRLLTRAHVDGNDRRALYIGAKAYEQAGGTVVRDLFDEEGEGWFSDPALLDRLVSEKLEGDAANIREEGWAWVEVRAAETYVDLSSFGRIRMVEVALPDEDEARLKQLSERYDELVTVAEDNEDAEANKDLDAVQSELEALQDRKAIWPGDGKKTAGAIVSLDYTGYPEVIRGLVRPEDKLKVESGERGVEPRHKSDERSDGYAASLLIDLSAHRTAALQEVVAARPEVALTALLHVLVANLLYDGHSEGCISIVPRAIDLRPMSPTLVLSKAMTALERRRVRWHERLPALESLWAWLEGLNRRDRLELLAYCTAVTLDATVERNGVVSREDADLIANAVALDMADWWQPGKDNFFDRVTKAQITQAVCEARSTEVAMSMEGLKKSEMAAKAEALVSETRWLPVSLRKAIEAGAANGAQEEAGE